NCVLVEASCSSRMNSCVSGAVVTFVGCSEYGGYTPQPWLEEIDRVDTDGDRLSVRNKGCGPSMKAERTSAEPVWIAPSFRSVVLLNVPPWKVKRAGAAIQYWLPINCSSSGFPVSTLMP